MNIALLGSACSEKLQLFAALDQALKKSGWQVTLLMPDTKALADILQSVHLTLLMGLGTAADKFQTEDQKIRAALADQGVAYAVLYGSGQERLAQALTIVENTMAPGKRNAKTREENSRPWIWLCDTCSDPQCEHRLLTDLLARRLTAP